MSEHDENEHDQAGSNGDAVTPTASKQHHARPRAASRDADAARSAAADRVAVAQQVASAVEDYHTAADRIDAANAELSAASQARLTAIHTLRSSKLTITEIGELTGLSPSRVQALAHAKDEG